MPAESIKLLRLLRMVYEAEASCTAELYVDMPGSSMTLAASFTLPATTGIEILNLPIAGTVKGFQVRVKFIPSGVFIGYQQSAIYARRVGRVASDWQWVPLDFAPSGGLIDVKIPLPPSGGAAEVKIPIPASGGDAEVKIPIPPSGGDATVRIPIPVSPDEQLWADLPEDE